MPGTETMVIPAWLFYATIGLGIAVALMIALQFLISLRQSGQFDMLAAQLSRSSDSLERDSFASREATKALQQQLSIALTQLRQARDRASRADQANQAKSAFLAKMSHELRTPLSAIIGFAEMIEHQSMGPLGNSKYQDYACDIRISGQHLLGIINDILDLSKVESGRENLREQRVEIAELVNGIRVLLEGRPQEAGVQLLFEVPEDAPALQVDKRRLIQILVNLLSNAIKFTPEGGNVRLRAWATEGSGFVFQVIDNGVGMAQKDIPVALSVFGQVDNQIGNHAGTGLGLPLAKALTEMHGGTLDLQSEVGKGTTATLRLPAHRMLRKSAAAAIEAVAS